VIPTAPRRGLGRALAVGLALVVAGCTRTPAPDGRAVAPSTTIGATTSTTTPASPASAVEVGPGPRSSYTIEAQPPAGSCRYGFAGRYPLPDPRCTPGAVNPQVSQADISSTICAEGYATGIRPAESVTEPEKIASAAAYGYTGPLHTAEYDHLIPLELGGDPNDPANLWVEPNDSPTATTTTNSKDLLEDVLNRLVCSRRMSLAAARQAIATDWVAAYRQYG
jgi:hypothetical protein